ncbi:MAG: FN3 associated domain-containing protein [Spirochaetota bacterium]
MIQNCSVAISTTSSRATIWYTDDDTDPKTSGNKKQYTSTVSINKTMTLKAYASKPPDTESDVSTAVYTMVDTSGNVYVTEYGNHRVQKFSPAQ